MTVSAFPAAARILRIVRSIVALAVAVLMTLAPAHADDISAAARGVVRVVTIAMVDGEVVGFGHGSGFAIAPNRIVTNAHVVEVAHRYPGNVVVGVVPSEGSKSYEGKVIAFDAARDLAIIEFTGARLPPVALYSGPVDEGSGVTALGYPGNVDLATAQSSVDYIHPLTPVRTEGTYSGRRAMSGTQVLLHTAAIARGNSGGPLLDPCGRVLGVNSAITQNQDGDSSFGFAIADSELTAFLAAAKQPYAAVGLPCTSLADTLKRDSDADAQAIAQADAAKRDAAARAALAHEAALAKARADVENSREDVMALAAVLLVAGALAVGGAGLLEVRGERRWAIGAGAFGLLLMVASAIVFLNRPTGDPVLPPDSAPAAVPSPPAQAASGKLLCSVVPERSRIVSSSTDPVKLDWGQDGCMNGRTQYAESGTKWERVLVPGEEQTVSLLQFDPANAGYTAQKYFLGADQMEAVRKIRAQIPLKACSADPGARASLATQQAAVRAALPAAPNEKIVYHCTADTAP
jgi:S1-C subfamily serine protease